MHAEATPASEAAPPTSRPRRLTLERFQHQRGNIRVFTFYSLAIGLTGIGSLLFADLLWRTGWSPARTVLLVLFTILFLMASVGCMHAIYGFVLRRSRDSRRITRLGDYRSRSIAGTSTALIFPVYNEDVARVFEGVRTTYQSLARTGSLSRFDIFVLSDSTDPDKWIEEERRWFELTQELGTLGRIFYRHRLANEGKKSGNIGDFLSVWGKRYRYFVVFDADSIMQGETIVDLVKLMEAHPTVGLIQTAPALINGKSAFARLQQFANRLYGPVFTAGLNYWSQDGGNYWGHNAIIRTEPFMEYCDLPKLPGRKPFGGQILSHDFVEAALLRKANWEVWFAWDLEGSYEEGPPSIVAHAQRDRRWCQGNLQHAMLLFARGFRGISRIHLTQGILGYLAGPLWLAFMLTGTYVLWFSKDTGLSVVAVRAFTPFLKLTAAQHAFLVFGLSMAVVLAPKVFSLLDLVRDRERRNAFGGMLRAMASVVVETLFSSLHAPIQMMFHTKFVLSTLLGFGVHWGAQQRVADGISWGAAWRNHWGHTALAVGWGAATWWLDPGVFWWFSPVLAGLALSVPISVLTSRESFGTFLRRAGLLVTPEEIATPTEIASLEANLGRTVGVERKPSDDRCRGLLAAVADPYINALHISLLRDAPAHPAGTARGAESPIKTNVRQLGERLLEKGAAALSAADQKALLSDPDTLAWLHHEYWCRGPSAAGAHL